MSRLILSFLLILNGTAFASVPLNVCITGTLVKVFPKYGEAFHKGALMGLSNNNVKIIKHYYDQDSLAPIKAMSNMIQSGCHAIVGFSFSNDLLAISKQARENNILVISIYGEIDDQLKDHPSIRTMQIPTKHLIQKLVSYGTNNLKLGWKKPFVVTDVDRTSMVSYRESLKLIFEKNKINGVWHTSTESHFDLNAVKADYLKQAKGSDVLILFTRSQNAASISDMVYSLPNNSKPVI